MTTARGPLPATTTGLPRQVRPPQQLDRHVERVAVEMGDHAAAGHDPPSLAGGAAATLRGDPGVFERDAMLPRRRRLGVLVAPCARGCPGSPAPRRRVDAGEVGQLAGAGARVEALRVALLAHLERRVDVDLEERQAAPPRAARARARGRAARGRRATRSRPCPASAISRATCATRRMFSRAVGGREAEVARQAVAQVVAVEEVGRAAGLDEAALERGGDRRLARRGQAGEPDRRAARARARPAVGAVEPGRRASVTSGGVRAPRAGRPARAATTSPAPTVSLRVLVDEDERAGRAVLGVRVGDDRRARAQRDARRCR